MFSEEELLKVDSILQENNKLKEFLKVFINAYDGGATFISNEVIEEIREYIK